MNSGRRTNDDINLVAARSRQLIGKFQELTRSEAERERSTWKTAFDRKPFHLATPVSLPAQGALMTVEEDIDSFKERIAKAESERDAWRVAGREEKYIEAYFMVEALELQLDERRRQHTADKASI